MCSLKNEPHGAPFCTSDWEATFVFDLTPGGRVFSIGVCHAFIDPNHRVAILWPAEMPKDASKKYHKRPKSLFYAVRVGREGPKVYSTWNECQLHVRRAKEWDSGHPLIGVVG
jgi:hypothetical protein